VSTKKGTKKRKEKEEWPSKNAVFLKYMNTSRASGIWWI
jgi:hypothetical protein